MAKPQVHGNLVELGERRRRHRHFAKLRSRQEERRERGEPHGRPVKVHNGLAELSGMVEVHSGLAELSKMAEVHGGLAELNGMAKVHGGLAEFNGMVPRQISRYINFN